MKTLEFTGINGAKISIPVQVITGFCEVVHNSNAYGNCFISTGADGADGNENGWYVQDDYMTVKAMYEARN